jgi:protein-disulfide isomerase-like protein with CxxC motif
MWIFQLWPHGKRGVDMTVESPKALVESQSSAGSPQSGAHKIERKVTITHFADPFCWWSWGLEPVLARLKEVYQDQITIIYRMGGMAESIADWQRDYAVDDRTTRDWVSESITFSQNPVNPDFIRKTGVTSSLPASRAYLAALLQSEELAHRFFRRLIESP